MAQKNLINKTKKKYVSTYFQERCVGGTKSDNFRKTIKSNISKKNTSGPSKVILTENSKIITNQNEVSEIFNIFYTSVANYTGKECLLTRKITLVYSDYSFTSIRIQYIFRILNRNATMD